MTTRFLTSILVSLLLVALSGGVLAFSPVPTRRLVHFETTLAATTSNRDTTTIDQSHDDGLFTRRGAGHRTAGIIAAVGIFTIFVPPAYATTNTVIHEIRIGSEDNPEELVFEPDTITIRSGDTVKWIKNLGMTQHNVVFAPQDVPVGVNAEKLSMRPNDRLKKESFERQFLEKGDYTYACTPHCTVMSGHITVI